MKKRRSRPSPKPVRPESIRPNALGTKAASTSSARIAAHGHGFNPKRCGELSELAFMYKAASLGFHVAKPYGDSERYDFILDAGHRLWRVQVKSTNTVLSGFYHVNTQRSTSKGNVPYRPEEVDFVAAHIVPEDAWFVLPVTLVQNRTSVTVPPLGHVGRPHRLAPYREAWDLLRER